MAIAAHESELSSSASRICLNYFVLKAEKICALYLQGQIDDWVGNQKRFMAAANLPIVVPH